MIKLAFVCSLLAGCSLNSVATPKTITLEAGTIAKHEVDEAPSRINTVNIKAMWELRK